MIELKNLNLRVITAAIQKLENKAAEKCAMRLLIMSMPDLFGKDGKEYIKKTVDLMLRDITPELEEAIRIGNELGEALRVKKA